MNRRQPEAIVAFLALLAACSGEPDTPTGVRERTGAPSPQADPRGALIAAADRRELDPVVVRNLRAPEPTRRVAAIEAVARLRDPAAAPVLRDALRDPDARVRLAASFGLSLLEDEPAEAPDRSQEAAILGALAAALSEPGPDRSEEIAQHVRDLGRIGAGRSLAAVRASLDHASAEVRLAATDALGAMGRRRVPVSEDVHAALLRAAGSDGDREVRLGSARALGALAPPVLASLRSSLRADLVAALGTASPDVAALLARAAIQLPPIDVPTAQRLAAHADPSAALEGMRLLVAAGPAGEAALASALGDLSERVRRGDARLAHVLLGDALAAAVPMARSGAVHRVAERIHAGLAAAEPASLPRDVAHCAAAELVDRGKGWPARVLTCGHGRIAPDVGPRRAAAILRDVPGDEALRAAFLDRLYDRGPDSVRAAVVESFGAFPLERAQRTLVDALGRDDVGVVSAALRQLPSRRGAILAAQLGPSLARPLAAARATLEAAGDAPGLVLLVDALATIPDARHPDMLRELAARPEPAVRNAAHRALRSIGAELPPAGSPAPPAPAAITPEALAGRPATRTYRVHTSAGAFDLELDVDAAPVTTLRFQERVARAFYDGLPFHARAPGLVLQGGDPRGDGYGSAGDVVRDEPSPSRFERGTVGLALAGPDTAGAPFFVTLADQPHLEGRYTPFARVVRGMPVVDALVPGDRIERIAPLD